jgi:hypothetical protein
VYTEPLEAAAYDNLKYTSVEELSQNNCHTYERVGAVSLLEVAQFVISHQSNGSYKNNEFSY